MASPDRAASSALTPRAITDAGSAATLPRWFTSVQPLLGPAAATWLIYVALGALLHARALRVYSAGDLPSIDFLRNAAHALSPEVLLTSSRYSAAGTIVLVLYAVLVCLAVASWCWGCRVARRLELQSSVPLVLTAALVATPLLAAPGLFSDDVYLYSLYGRIIDAHGGNPIVAPPMAFPQDPHLSLVYWRELPSAYGPVWLMLSGVLSGIAGESLTGVMMTYRVAGLLLHLLTAAAVWLVLRRARPGDAAAGTILYAWNPLVLVEVVGNAHNDVLVAAFAVLMVAAAAQRAWSSAAFFGACAVMVKPFAALLLPPLGLRMMRASRSQRGSRVVLAALATGAVTLALISIPLWAGTQLLDNISKNPASHMYTNTLWELVSEAGPAWFGTSTVSIQHPYLDALREACFIIGALWVLTRRRASRALAPTALSLWLVFCLTACWVWPWYFVPAVALAAMAGRHGIAAAAALTLGGLLFWTTWPPPTNGDTSALHTWRSVVLFGPLLVTLVHAPTRDLILHAFGGRPDRSRQPREVATN